jgi:hypothetical protein
MRKFQTSAQQYCEPSRKVGKADHSYSHRKKEKQLAQKQAVKCPRKQIAVKTKRYVKS